ncbi:MAG: primosomal protein N' [Peptoniphilus sp.]|nr:primosomal protein N' [Peptoniphilus sp.]MDD7362940.1 primosomal protein N' [Bacillota bacterium]MDY6044180.1 primosomal protein N' [Peptoniphilus sp.]
MIVNVYIDKALPQIDQLYSYSWDGEEDLIGRRVIVPFGRGDRREVAVVISSGGDADKPLKPVLDVPDLHPMLSRSAIALGLAMREMFLTSYVQSFQPLLPKYVLGDVVEICEKCVDNDATKTLMGEESEIAVAEIKKEVRPLLATALEEQWVRLAFQSTKPVKRRKKEYYGAVDGYDRSLTEKQQTVYDLILKKGPLSKAAIREETGFSDSPMETLLGKGALRPSQPPLPRREEPPVLRVDQKKAIEAIERSDRRGHLLFGDTGTGKTEVYMQLAQRAMDRGLSSLMIVPEIGLAAQMVDRLSARFPGKVDILHSQRSEGEKAEAWLRLKNEPGRIVVGARSAVFTQVPSLGYIFIDEEQEESYDYQEGLRYDVRKVAEMRSKIEGGKVVYGSATPSVKTYARTGRELERHRLTGDPDKTKRPSPIEVVDMREELLRGNTEILSARMVEGLEETLRNQKQAILFINRRGFSHFVSCRRCGHVIECDACDISMVYHRKTGRMHCHYCGRTKPYPRTCPVCGSEYLKQFGIGTEQVESWIARHFPEARVLRMDKDTMSQKGKYEKLYRSMQNHEADVLVGTQMLAKGFDFKDVDFVGVVAADLSLFVSDYRAQERTFQLLTQVAGRAGRGERRGRAVIQTYNPENYSISYARDREYERFYHREMEERRRFLYPPYIHLVKIHVRGTGKVEETAYNWQKTLGAINRHEHLDVQIAEPVEQPKIKNKRHYSVTAKVFPEEYRTFLKVLKRVLMNYYQNITEKNIYVTLELDG